MHNRLAEEAAYFAAVDAGRDSAQEEIDQLRAENEHLLTLLSLIVHVLPSRRDWLDPNLEKAAKNAIAHAKAKGQGGE